MGFGTACSSFCEQWWGWKLFGNKALANKFFEVKSFAINGIKDFEVKMTIVLLERSVSLAARIHCNDKSAPSFWHWVILRMAAWHYIALRRLWAILLGKFLGDGYLGSWSPFFRPSSPWVECWLPGFCYFIYIKIYAYLARFLCQAQCLGLFRIWFVMCSCWMP